MTSPPIKLAVAGMSVFVLLQLVRPRIPTGPASAEMQAPPQVRHILEKDCYSCHSDQRRLAWFDEVVPGYWLVRHDILTAREHLDFSTLGAKPAAAQKATLYEAVNMIQLGAMPLPQFTALHPDAKVTPEELAILKAYLVPWGSSPPNKGSTPGEMATVSAEQSSPVDLLAVGAEFNGLAFESGFENWKPISFTDRGDNNTFRFILGNDVAVKAAQSGDISPWPDGARFAKIAWQQELGIDGLIYPGKFVQVEFMVKAARLYKQTDGWGWGRWRGMDLTPYGKDAHFVTECTSCHLPVRGDDDVYTLPITSAKSSHSEVVNNRAAGLPQGLPYQPLTWSAITMYVDPGAHTMATLFGNDRAERAVRTHGAVSSEPRVYPAGAVLALITWAQREDPHWFGGRIADTPQSVEFVQVDAQGGATTYRRFDGPRLREDISPSDLEAKRRNFILNLTPAILP
jgi:hypothetical protein